ncbi:MAG: hypothetical protein Q7U97_06160 [Rhodocyclaceae bacterium]|nr:hypothetical protein [Rhodocyclaceae bacterium]
MLCMQQCIDLCDFTPEEARSIRDCSTLAEIMAIQSQCPRLQAAADGTVSVVETIDGCEMLDIRDQLLEEVWAAEKFSDLEQVVLRYRAYAIAQAAEAGGPQGDFLRGADIG